MFTPKWSNLEWVLGHFHFSNLFKLFMVSMIPIYKKKIHLPKNIRRYIDTDSVSTPTTSLQSVCVLWLPATSNHISVPKC